MFTQEVHRVMAPVIKNILLNQIENHWGGKCLAALPWLSKTRCNLDFSAGLGTVHHQDPPHPRMSLGYK